MIEVESAGTNKHDYVEKRIALLAHAPDDYMAFKTQHTLINEGCETND